MKKERTYLPDFFLLKYNLYLDVKNPIKQIQDKSKILQLKNLLSLEVGDIDYIKSVVSNLMI